ncbi:RNA methyltransferase [Bdellovibrionota bacterium FG-2]
MSVRIRNPHSLLAVLKTRPKDVQKIQISRGMEKSGNPDDPWQQVLKLARDHKIQVSTKALEPPHGGFSSSDEGGREGGAEGTVKEKDSIPMEQLFSGASEKKGGRGLWLALDCLQDPHNVGAIFRAAGFFGVQGILLTQERSAPISPTVYDVASGGVEVVPFSLQTNLQQALQCAKDQGIWVLGTSEHAKEGLETVKPDRPWLLVLGNEEKGMRRLTQESCDVLCGIQPKGSVTSLNVSVAAGVLMSHLTK